MLTIVAAISKNGIIGQGGNLPWHIPEDMVHYKKLTMGKVIVMGRKTWESIPEKYRPLSGRTNVVITSQEGYLVPPGVQIFNSLEQALETHKHEDVIINGGAQIYEAAMPHVHRLEITHVDQEVVGDTSFPRINPALWQEVAREDHPGFSFVSYTHR